MTTLTKEQFFARKPRTKVLNVPLLGGELKVQEITLAQRNDIHARSIVVVDARTAATRKQATVDNTKFVVWTIIHGVVNEDGSQMFNDSDYNRLAGIVPFDLLDEVQEEIWSISGSSSLIEKNEAGEK